MDKTKCFGDIIRKQFSGSHSIINIKSLQWLISHSNTHCISPQALRNLLRFTDQADIRTAAIRFFFFSIWVAFVCLSTVIRIYPLLPEKAMAPHSSTLAWKIPGTEEPGRLQSMGPLRVGHNWSDLAAVASVFIIYRFLFWPSHPK